MAETKGNNMGASLPGSWQFPSEFAKRVLDNGSGTSVTWLNHWSAMRADWNAISQSDFVGVDGTLLQLILGFSGVRVGRSSADLAIPRYLSLRPTARIALIGGGGGVALRAAAKLHGVVFVADGYKQLEQVRRAPQELISAAPDVVVLGLGAGLQDAVAAELSSALPQSTIFTAGGWLDQLSESEQYFPPIVHSLRLGWLWRIIHEPRRLIGRYTIDAVKAVLQARRLAARVHASVLQTAEGDLRGRASRSALAMAETQSPPRLLQVVTQLEPAGAQSMAKWTEDALSDDFAIETWFLYDKSGSDLFPAPNLVAAGRPKNVVEVVAFVRSMMLLRRQRPDVVLAHTHFAIAAALILWPRRAKISLVGVHHWPVDRYPGPVRHLIRAARRAGRFTDEVYVSPAIVDQDDPTIIPNPVPRSSSTQRRGTQKVDILVVARHAEEKSLDTVIRAMANLPDRHLTLVGGGPLTEDLRSCAAQAGVSDRVVFSGRLPNSEVRGLMRDCSVFVLPSLWEAMPVSLLEAVAENCAIVVSDIVTHRFLLDRGAALSFPPGDAPALADAINRAQRNDVDLQAGLAQVRDVYGDAAISGQWRNLLHRGVASR